MLENLAAMSGAPQIVRIGGLTQNLAVYRPDQVDGVIRGYPEPDADQPNSVDLGPSWYESASELSRGD